MKKIIIYLFLILISADQSKVQAGIDIKARTVILQDYLSGKILYEKEPDIKSMPLY